MIIRKLLKILLENSEQNEIDICINKFEDGRKNIEKALSNNRYTLTHNDRNLFLLLKEIVNNFVKKYFEKEKYKKLVKSIFDYNSALNLYLEKNGDNNEEIKTVGDCFRQLGGKTEKKISRDNFQILK